jgi:four helix bundle protein
MATIQRFEELEAWILARQLSKAIYQITETGKLARDVALHDQMRRAAVSVGSNIAEGFERDGNKEFRQFLSYAKGSAGELRAQLYMAADANYLPEEHFTTLMEMAQDTSNVIGGLMRYLDNSAMRGSKYR